MILKVLTAKSYLSEQEIARKLQVSPEKIKNNLVQLEKEGFITRKREKIRVV